MKKITTFLALTLLALQSFAHINFIDFNKISRDSKLSSAFNFIKSNTKYYERWTPEWKYDKSKEELIKELRNHFTSFSTLSNKNAEVKLLLGDIAHYLYNMDDTAYFDDAVDNYSLAMTINPKDYRPYWFLGYHYALSNAPAMSIENMIKAHSLLPAEQSEEFWNEYAETHALANMPSHCIYAMDKVKAIKGKEGWLEAQIGPAIRQRIKPVHKDSFYKKEDIWTAAGGETSKLNAFTSRPFGVRIITDTSWKLTIYDYEKRQGAFIINPPRIENNIGTQIGYTIAMLVRIPNEQDKLEDYIDLFTKTYTEKTKINLSNKYDRMIAYEIKDKTLYPEIGGAHLYMIGIERDAPAYPGLLLEKASALPVDGSENLSIYMPHNSKDRFKGKIFYAIMLDSCEDIHAQSFAIFKSWFDQLVIE